MRVAIDARGVNWYKGTGIGTYTENLLRCLIDIDTHNHYHLFWSGGNFEDYKNDNVKIIMASKKHHKFFEQFYFPNNLSKEQVDIFHVPQNGIGLFADSYYKKVITVHDLIPYVMPETVGKGYLMKFLNDIPKVVEMSDAIITVSEWSKRDILRFFPVDESKVFVTPLAADKKYRPLDRSDCKEFLRNMYNINGPFILYVGGFSPRKNVKSLIIAFSKIFKDLNKEYSLVIVGANKDDATYLNELSNNLDVSKKIIFTGFVPEDDLPILYNGCDAFVYPSLYEGFGLPPLEAMSCGTPVITSNISSIPEVVEDCGILINPYDTSNLMEALVTLLNDENLKQELRIKGLNRSKEFSWKKTAENTLKVYESIYNSNEA